ncbi:MAG: NAD-dependent epimerase/dehydratase family protein [Betaproteobacteria bacterium]|nr:NAD-dependent epimerase/dehydratase family protein [Betaproteobacteria bacterium]
MKRRVLVTGATGFVARALLSEKSANCAFVASSRRPLDVDGVEWRRSPSLSASADWKPLLEGIDSVVHLAGRVHRPSDQDLSAYHAENCDGTTKLARDAIASGARRFVFLSTSKVLGEESGPDALAETSQARPGGAYAESKLSAERSLAELRGSLQIAVLRPPLVYGPGVKANFLALLSAVDRGLPLPLASIRNRRSLIGVDNLASAIIACLDSPRAAGRTFHVTDGVARSTPELVRAIASALGRPARMFPFPPALLEACGALIGRGDTVRRLTRSLELDDRAIRTEIGWRAPRTFENGIGETVRWFRRTNRP